MLTPQSPLPWKISHPNLHLAKKVDSIAFDIRSGSDIPALVLCRDMKVPRQIRRTDAEYIVQSANAFPELASLLTEAREQLEQYDNSPDQYVLATKIRDFLATLQ